MPTRRSKRQKNPTKRCRQAGKRKASATTVLSTVVSPRKRNGYQRLVELQIRGIKRAEFWKYCLMTTKYQRWWTSKTVAASVKTQKTKTMNFAAQETRRGQMKVTQRNRQSPQALQKSSTKFSEAMNLRTPPTKKRTSRWLWRRS